MTREALLAAIAIIGSILLMLLDKSRKGKRK